MPEFEASWSILLFLMGAAFLAGCIDSVAGGGGLLSLPAMLLAGVPAQTALGTGKFMATMGTGAAFVSFLRNGLVDLRVAGAGVLFSFFGSAAGARAVLYFDNEILGKIILCMLPVAAILTFFPLKKHAEGSAPGRLSILLLTPLVCLAVGFYDGFFGPGTGSFLLLSMHLILGMNLVAASGTAKAFNLASNISGLGIFLMYGKVSFLVGIPMALANVAGNLVGARMAMKGGPRLVRRMLLFSLALLFGTLVVRYYG